MMNSQRSLDDFFEQRTVFPDIDARERFNRLIGIDDKILRLKKALGLLINSSGLRKWFTEYHPNADSLIETMLRRPALIVLSGDVGSGKSELAETIGDAVARQEDIEVTLLPLSLSTRGEGRVGEMTKLISEAFDHALKEANKLKSSSGAPRGGVILLIDEADALAQSRENTQMHHEDRAGVNAFIRGIDRIANNNIPAAVIMCTNRIGALDPAIKRRASDILTFTRPNEEQRFSVLSGPLRQLGFDSDGVSKIVKATGPNESRSYGFTYSDLIQRLIPSIVLDSYPEKAVTAQGALSVVQTIEATPPFKEQ